MRLPRPLILFILLGLILALLAWMRPIDHDESQYVAATLLAAHGFLPYRDFAYLQTPLQPLILAPVALVAGTWTWPALRLVNALLGTAIVGFTWRAARVAGAGERQSLLAAALLATTDTFLFSVGTARNDALPAALFAATLPLLLAPRRTRASMALAGALLAAAAATKISYAFPAAAAALWSLRRPARLPHWLAAGALPVLLAAMLLIAQSPAGARFGILTFPAAAPTEYYLATGRAFRLTVAGKLLDTLKFLGLGPALLALAVALRRPRAGLPEWLVAAGLAAALLTSPVWRQYFLPALPPLFVCLALAWTRSPPGKAMRIASVVFACAGLATTIATLAEGGGMTSAAAEGARLRSAMDASRVSGPVFTAAPQFLAFTGRMPDARAATGPFYLRSDGLVPAATEARLRIVSRRGLATAALPPAVVIGGEGAWTHGDAAVDADVERRARALGYRQAAAAGRLRLLVRPPAAAPSPR